MLQNFDTYLIFKITGILIFILLGAISCRTNGVTLKKSLLVTILTVIAGYFGSTFWYIIQHLYGKDPYERGDFAFMMDSAGSVLYGWILAGTTCVWFLTKALKIDTRKILDALVPWLLVAQILNRFGCFAGECCYGRPSQVFWGVYNSYASARVHPVQLYEAFLDSILLILVLRQPKELSGRRTLIYFIGYSVGRFFLEFFRGDNQPAALGLTVPQMTSVVIFLCAILFLWNFFQAKRKYN